MSKHKIGLELELHLIDAEGNVTNRAPEILADADNTGYILKECSKSMVEVIAPPHADMDELTAAFSKEVNNLMRIAERHGLRLLPSTTIGSDADVEGSEGTRYASKKAVLGDKKRTLEYHICGTHVHVDSLTGGKESTQYQVTTALDPAFALMSSTPFFSGKNSLSDYRVHIYRDVVFDGFPLQGQLLPHISSISEANARQTRTYEGWVEEVKKHGFNGEGFTTLNTCWGPVKLTEKTIESRGSDANTLSRVFALAALYKGVTEMIDQHNPTVRIASDGTSADTLFTLRDNVLTLPSYNQLKRFEQAGIHEGLENPELRTYLHNVLAISKDGLPVREQKYLAPFEASVETGNTLSTDIINFAKERGIYQKDDLPQGSARAIRNYIADTLTEDMHQWHPR